MPIPIYLFSPSALDLKDEWFSYYTTGVIHACDDEPVVPICTYLFATGWPLTTRDPAPQTSAGAGGPAAFYMPSPFSMRVRVSFQKKHDSSDRWRIFSQVGSQSKLCVFSFDRFTRLSYWAELFHGNGAEVFGLRSQE